MLVGLLGSISIIVLGSTALSSVSLEPIAAIVIAVSSDVILFSSFTAIGASFIGLTVIVKVVETVTFPSVTLYVIIG